MGSWYSLGVSTGGFDLSGTISQDDVRHVAKLSRLKLSDEQVAHFAEQLSAVLEHVSKLSELNVDNVEPLAHPLDLRNVLREDREEPGMATAKLLASAPDSDEPYFKVIKVLGEGSGA